MTWNRLGGGGGKLSRFDLSNRLGERSLEVRGELRVHEVSGPGVDSAPTSGSANLVTSGGVKTALDNVSTGGVTIDDNVADSDNLVRNSGVFAALPAGTPPTNWSDVATGGNLQNYETAEEARAAYHPLTAVDANPANASTNLVTSGGVFSSCIPVTRIDHSATYTELDSLDLPNKGQVASEFTAKVPAGDKPANWSDLTTDTDAAAAYHPLTSVLSPVTAPGGAPPAVGASALTTARAVYDHVTDSLRDYETSEEARAARREFITESEADDAYHPKTTVDSGPSGGSANLVTSGGVATEFTAKVPAGTKPANWNLLVDTATFFGIQVDTIMNAGGTVPVSSALPVAQAVHDHVERVLRDYETTEEARAAFATKTEVEARASYEMMMILHNQLKDMFRDYETTEEARAAREFDYVDAARDAISEMGGAPPVIRTFNDGLVNFKRIDTTTVSEATSETTYTTDALPTSDAVYKHVTERLRDYETAEEARAARVSVPLDADQIADGSVSNAEFQYLNGVTSAVQTQLDAKQAAITQNSVQVGQPSVFAWIGIVNAWLDINSSVSDATLSQLVDQRGVRDHVTDRMRDYETTDEARAWVRDHVLEVVAAYHPLSAVFSSVTNSGGALEFESVLVNALAVYNHVEERLRDYETTEEARGYVRGHTGLSPGETALPFHFVETDAFSMGELDSGQLPNKTQVLAEFTSQLPAGTKPTNWSDLTTGGPTDVPGEYETAHEAHEWVRDHVTEGIATCVPGSQVSNGATYAELDSLQLPNKTQVASEFTAKVPAGTKPTNWSDLTTDTEAAAAYHPLTTVVSSVAAPGGTVPSGSALVTAQGVHDHVSDRLRDYETAEESDAALDYALGYGHDNGRLIADLRGWTPSSQLASITYADGGTNRCWGDVVIVEASETIKAGRFVAIKDENDKTTAFKVVLGSDTGDERSGSSHMLGVAQNNADDGEALRVCIRGATTAIINSSGTLDRGQGVHVEGSGAAGRVRTGQQAKNEPIVGWVMEGGSVSANDPILVWVEPWYQGR